MKKYWPTCAKSSVGKPGKVSIILPCDNEGLSYLHMDTKTLAFRIPDKKDLRELLEKTGPLVAPSANHAGETPALTVEEAKKYFDGEVDFCVDGGRAESLPSTIIKIENDEMIVLREGAVKL